ncbi:MAG: hypothetical protein WBA16_04350 [Nonlabens sp.]
MKYLYLLLAVLVLSSCSNEENLVVEDAAVLKTLNLERAPGVVPSSIKLNNALKNVSSNPLSYILLLQDYQRKHGDTDYYNNLFELSVQDLLVTDKIKELDDESLLFILDQFRMVESNLLNLDKIEIVLRSAYKRDLVTRSKFLQIAEELVSKNKQEIQSIDWNNLQIRDEKIKELNALSFQLNYPRLLY